MSAPSFLRLSTLAVVVLGGCGGSGLDTAPVTGTVTLDGEPLSGATVTFVPERTGMEAPSSQGMTDAQGRYALSVVATGDEGAVIGQHQVTINVFPEQEDPTDDADLALTEEQIVPARYNEDSELTYEVKDGSNVADWALSN
ncbi:MAG: carboxypeptidase-like regulatory domain-containing protein [Planctomycetes bacterium]|nr:carboxypeptidase-like regulatory domain-containing protein [Planctomycetota bacterium]